MPNNNLEKSETLKAINFKNQFNHRKMIRKPKTEGKPEVIYYMIFSSEAFLKRHLNGFI